MSTWSMFYVHIVSSSVYQFCQKICHWGSIFPPVRCLDNRIFSSRFDDMMLMNKCFLMSVLVYAADMPKRLPIYDIVGGLLKSVGKALKYWFHYTLVAIAWLGVVPLTACKLSINFSSDSNIDLAFLSLWIQNSIFLFLYWTYKSLDSYNCKNYVWMEKTGSLYKAVHMRIALCSGLICSVVDIIKHINSTLFWLFIIYIFTGRICRCLFTGSVSTLLTLPVDMLST